MYEALAFIAAAATETGGATDVVSVVITSVVSATVFSALITSFVQFLISRRTARIAERKDAIDAESDLITRYKEAAAEERVQKASAIDTIKELLAASNQQVDSLSATVDAMTSTITMLEKLTLSQSDMIITLTADRDRAKAALVSAEALVESQKEQLKIKQAELQAVLERTRNSTDAARIAAETLGSAESVVQ